MKDCDNKLGEGKLLYNPTGWYENQDFFTKEKCRPITVEIKTKLIGKNKDWNECKELVEKEKGQMLSFAEMLYFYQEYFKQTGKYIDEYEWSWTSSRSSSGRLVSVGSCASVGVDVFRDWPDDSYSYLGVRFFRSALPEAEAGQAAAVPCNLEMAIEKVKEAGFTIVKII